MGLAEKTRAYFGSRRDTISLFWVSQITNQLILGIVTKRNVTKGGWKGGNENIYDDDDEQYDPTKSKKRGAGPKISVKKTSKW